MSTRWEAPAEQVGYVVGRTTVWATEEDSEFSGGLALLGNPDRDSPKIVIWVKKGDVI